MTYDYSQVSPILEDTLVTGVVIDAPTGPLEVTKVSSLSEFLSLYTTTGDITADDHVTMLHTAKLLQFTPVYISRACSSEVLPARSDKTANDGSSLVFTDTTYNPYYKEMKWEFVQADDAKGAYVVFKVAKNSGTVLATEDGAYIYTEDDGLIKIEQSTATVDYDTYAIVMANKLSDDSVDDHTTLVFMNDAEIVDNLGTPVPSDHIYKVGEGGSDVITAFAEKYLGEGSDIIDLKKACSIDFILKNFNSLLDTFSEKDTSVPAERVSKVTTSDNYINVSSGLYIVLDHIYPEPTIIDNVTNDKYRMLTFNDSDEYGKFTGIETDAGGSTYSNESGKVISYEDGVGPADYYNINGVSYHKTSESENANIPGTLDPLTVYKGYNSTGIEFDVMDPRMSTQDFFIYMLDKQMEEDNIKPILCPSKLSYTVSLKSNSNYLFDPNEDGDSSDSAAYTLSDINVKLIGSQIKKLLRVNKVSGPGSKLTAADLKYDYIQDTDGNLSSYYVKTGFDCSTAYGFTKITSDNIYKFVNGAYQVASSVHEATHIRIENKDIYMLLPKKDNMIEIYKPISEYIQVRFDSMQSLDKLDNCVIKFELKFNKVGGDTTIIEPLYFILNDYISDKYDPNYNPEMDEATEDNKFVFTDIHTIQKFVYRIAEFFTYENLFLTNLGVESSYWKDNGTELSYNKVPAVVDDPTLYYYGANIETYSTSLYTSSKVLINLDQLGEDDKGYKFHDYNITNAEFNLGNKVYKNQWVKVTRQLPEASPQITIFYNGTYPKAQQPGETLVRISSAKLTYLQFYNELVASMKTKYNLAPITGGIAIYEYDTGCTYDIKDSGIFESPYTYKEKDYTELLEKSALIVVSKYVSNDNICKFTIEVDEDDPELYNLKLTRKSNSTDYVISFNPSKTDGYGIARFYTYVNDEDNGSRDFYLFRLNESDQNVPDNKVVSPLFGSEVMLLKAGVTDYKIAYERFEEFTGIYYDFIFDAGYANTSVANCISNLCQKIYALGILTCPDIYDYNQLITYRQSIGVDHWSSVLQAPRTPDTTLGEYVIDMSPGCQYLQRIILNKNGGKEFAPCFWFTNGSVTLKPKYKYLKKDVQKALVNQQISPIIWDRARQQAYFCLDLTTQSADSSLSDANNVRMINVMAHLCDNIAQGYIGRYNDEATRNEFVAALDLAIRTRMINNQQYKPDDYRIICNETNNPVEQIELRNLIVDILVKFRPGIRYVKVYQKVYKLSQDLSAV